MMPALPAVTDETSAQTWLRQLPVDDAAMARLESLIVLLRQENRAHNLVSAASLEAMWQRHIVDSAQLLLHVPRETSREGVWLDLGTGAGFPGLVIAALQPERPVWMVESRARRIDWLERARQAMHLDQAKVIGERLEAVESFPASVVSARAFAPLDRLLDLSARFSTADTVWLLPKGRSAAQELHALAGWQHRFHVEHSLTDADSGIIVGTLSAPKSADKRRVKR